MTLPGHARLRPRLLPDSERLGVNDPAPAVMPRPPAHRQHPGGGEAAALVGLELGADLGWPPAAVDGIAAGAAAGRLDSREQRRALLARFAAHPPRRLLVAIDARATPDRGSLGLIGELAEHAVDTRIWALATARGASGGAVHGDRLALWREGLAGLGLAADTVVTDGAEARAWLAADEGEREAGR